MAFRIERGYARTAPGWSALIGVGLLLAGINAALADPPSHAPAHGYRRKQEASQDHQYRRDGYRGPAYRDDRDGEYQKRAAEREREWEKRQAERDRERYQRRAEQEREWYQRQAEIERDRDRWARERGRDYRQQSDRDREGYRSRDGDPRPRVTVRERTPSRDDRDGDGVSNAHDRYPRDRNRR